MQVISIIRHLPAMIQRNDPKNCLTCDKPLKGRSDKKFCDDYCRNTYNNHLRSGNDNYVRNINNILKKNRKILECLLSEVDKTVVTSKEKLIELGFRFNYYTNSYTTSTNKVYFFCYEFGWLPLENDGFLIVKRGS